MEVMPTIVLGWVCLQVSSLERSQAFYERIGLRTALLKPPFAVLTSADTATALLILWERPGTHPAAPDMTGLYHVALRLPGETALAGVLRHLLRQGILLEGASDHLVSQALYLSDPDGNGIELYADRPRHTWQRRNGELLMATRPLDVERLLSRAPAPLPILPEGTSIGHLHLRVAQLDAAERFYAGMLGLEVQLRSYPGALFFAADGYHHHIGVNTWGAPRRLPSEHTAGLLLFTLGVHSNEVFHQLRHRCQPAAIAQQEQWMVLSDPWRHRLLIMPLPALPTTPEAAVGMLNQLLQVLQ
jgi:catechol 2,3-dioxygenase